MKLYLSSLTIPDPDALLQLVGLEVSETRVGIVENAFDNASPQLRNRHVCDSMAALQGIGYQPQTIDLRKVTTTEAMRARLADIDLLWVTGGNTFYLRYVARISGLEAVIGDFLERGVYGGESAGAVLMGQSLHGIEHLDDPSEAPMVLFGGLSVVPFSVLPHWGSIGYEQHLQAAQRELLASSDEVVTLSDEQYMIIDGDSRIILQ